MNFSPDQHNAKNQWGLIWVKIDFLSNNSAINMNIFLFLPRLSFSLSLVLPLLSLLSCLSESPLLHVLSTSVLNQNPASGLMFPAALSNEVPAEEEFEVFESSEQPSRYTSHRSSPRHIACNGSLSDCARICALRIW